MTKDKLNQLFQNIICMETSINKMKHKQTQHVANACHKGDVCSIQLGGIDTSPPPGIFLGLRVLIHFGFKN